ncbi:MAG: hypothetical protein Q4A60_06225 [Pasteurellaceae bacterium]|nr:hypothetical protein [Pasteurellaceae bacterium]
MENQEHPDFDADAAFNEVADTLEKGEQSADNSPSDAEQTNQDTPDQRDSEAQTEPDLPEWLASATDEVKDNFRKLQADNQRYQHQARSQNGRVGALTKKYQQAQAEIERLKQAQTHHFNDDLKNLEEDYPEFAQMFRKLAEHQEKQLAQYARPIEQLAQAEMHDLAQQQLDNSIDYVSQVMPDASDIVVSQQFNNWLSHQPTGVQALFYSDNVDDAIYLLSEYKKNLSAGAERRSKQNQQFAALSLPNGRNAPKSGEALDEDALFNQIANQMKQQRD